MSWKLTKEVREARFAGLLKDLTPNEFFVLFIMADTCRSESRVARIGIQELLTLTGFTSRTSMSRLLTRLEATERIKQLTIGNQYQTSSYEILISGRISTDTSTPNAACSPTATSTDEVDVALESVDVSVESVDVALQSSGRSSTDTHPESAGSIPIKDPEEERASTSPTPSDLDIVDAEVIPIQQTDNPYEHLGFMSSATEPPLGGIAPPSRFCHRHQPSGTNDSCWACGTARTYRDNQWPHTKDGFDYTSHQAMSTQMAKRKGRHDAPAAESALAAGVTLPERNQRVLDMLASKTAEFTNSAPAPNGHALNGHALSQEDSIDESSLSQSDQLVVLSGQGALSAKAVDIQGKSDVAEAREQLPVLVRDELRDAGIGKTPRQNGQHREPRPLDVDCPTCHAPKGNACRAPGTRRLISPPHPARDEAAQRRARIA
jgi:hypothetical protein